MQEDVAFTITVVDGKKNPSGVIDRHNGCEIGDSYTCEYGCPADFCQKSMLKAFPLMNRSESGEICAISAAKRKIKSVFVAPDGMVTFLLEAKRSTR